MDVLSFNTFDGQSAKCLWVFNNFRYLQLLGLFIAGMLIGRQGIHKSEEKMVKYSRLFYLIVWLSGQYFMLLPSCFRYGEWTGLRCG